MQLCSTYINVCEQGFCVPPEYSEVEGMEGEEFVDIEAGGFDEGEGTKNVSNDIEKDNLASLKKLICIHTSCRIQVAIIHSQMIRTRMKMMKVLIWMRTLMVVLKIYLRKVKRRGKNDV